MLTKDDIHTLANVVIPNLMQIDLFPNLAQPKDLLPPIDSNKKKTYYNQHPIDQFFPLEIKIFECLHIQANVFLHNSANVVWNLKGLESLHIFCLDYFSSLKDFNHITKDASIFHLKLGGGRKPNYFPTSTPLQHTSHHHGRPIASDRFSLDKIRPTYLGGQIFVIERF